MVHSVKQISVISLLNRATCLFEALMGHFLQIRRRRREIVPDDLHIDLLLLVRNKVATFRLHWLLIVEVYLSIMQSCDLSRSTLFSRLSELLLLVSLLFITL